MSQYTLQRLGLVLDMFIDQLRNGSKVVDDAGQRIILKGNNPQIDMADDDFAERSSKRIPKGEKRCKSCTGLLNEKEKTYCQWCIDNRQINGKMV